VDSFPGLTYLPQCMQWWRKRGQELYDKTCETFQPIQDRMLRRIENGEDQNCFGKMMLDSQAQLGLSDHQAMFIGTVLPLSPPFVLILSAVL
jgi:hypothetical protein